MLLSQMQIKFVAVCLTARRRSSARGFSVLTRCLLWVSLGLPAPPDLPPVFRHLSSDRQIGDLRCNVPPPLVKTAAWKSNASYHPQNSLSFLKMCRRFTAICCWTVKEGTGRHWQKVDDSALPLFLWGSAWGSLACLNCSEAHCCRDELQPVSPEREYKRGITGGGQHGLQAGTERRDIHPTSGCITPSFCCNNQTLGKRHLWIILLSIWRST